MIVNENKSGFRNGADYSGNEIFTFEPEELTSELRDEAIKAGGNKTQFATVYLEKEGSWRKELIKRIDNECKDLLKKITFGGEKLEFGEFVSQGRPGIYKELIPFPDTKYGPRINVSFTGIIKGKFGNFEVEFSGEFMNNHLPEFIWTSDYMESKMDDYFNKPKVQAFLKQAYLDIPDTQQEDETFMKSKTIKDGWGYAITSRFNSIPKSFIMNITSDPTIRAYIGAGEESSDQNWSKMELISQFNKLNKKYYKEWQKIHRKGLKGAARNLKAWFLSLREHKEYGEAPMIVESFDTFINEMYMGPADGKGAFDDHQKKQQGYYKDAVSSEPGGFGNGGNAGAPAVGENDSPSMMSTRLGDIEPDGYPSAAGQDFRVTQPGSKQIATDPDSLKNM